MSKPLTPKQQRFVEEYLVDLDGPKAYIRAGYRVSSGVAAKKAAALLAREDVQEAIKSMRASGAKIGRPSAYSEEIADRICAALVEGRSLRSICLDDGIPAQSTVFYWLSRDLHPDFSERYARAREAQADAIFDEILDIADDGSNDYVTRTRDDGSEYQAFDAEHVQRSKLRIDARKWMAGKLQPKKYGDATTVKHADADGEKIELDDVAKFTRLAAIAAQAHSMIGEQGDEPADDAG
ncbi:terminase small subunit [Novosphingobium pentaromativorans]|uniref:Terminase small subunit n=1 Tax=Novosphingobium pentaromativorans US6-1 TaxID=1088721 RepID=G6E8T2_9SPHN|nr:terminase small subunit [Novosphingobium pentaromativorans]EHJ62156.1 hypothetical protein NSU_0753 [Novosphingobium pentaromativorans US6-1]